MKSVVVQTLERPTVHAETIIGIKQGLESMKRGEGRPASEVFDMIRQKHQIPPFDERSTCSISATGRDAR
ncbi:MAG: hypothetical protein AAGD38_02490 [Acidobacteriota bacterium]